MFLQQPWHQQSIAGAEPEPCCKKIQLRSRSRFIFTRAPQSWFTLYLSCLFSRVLPCNCQFLL